MSNQEHCETRADEFEVIDLGSVSEETRGAPGSKSEFAVPLPSG